MVFDGKLLTSMPCLHQQGRT